MGILLPGLEMKKLIVKTTEVEGVFESSFQTLLIAYFWLGTGYWDSAMISYLVIIAKAGVVNFLWFGNSNKIVDIGLGQKLCLLARYIPVFNLTSVFRLSTVICIINSTVPVGIPILLFFSTFLPFLILLSSKCCSLTDLTVSVEWGQSFHLSLYGDQQEGKEVGKYNFSLDYTFFSLHTDPYLCHL
jgi:hypothetical protein